MLVSLTKKIPKFLIQLFSNLAIKIDDYFFSSRIIDSGENVSSLLFVPTMKNVAKLDKVSLLAVGLSKGPIKLFNILTGK